MSRLVLASVLMLAIAARAESQARTGAISVGDATINYELSGSGKTIVLVHGWANTLGIWDEVMPAFSQKYQVLRYDRRGFGKSSGFADPSADPDDLRILLDSLGIKSAYVVGLSAGANAALRFAFAFPDRIDALVFYGGGPPEGFPIPYQSPPPVATWKQIARDYGVDSLGKFIYASPLAWHPPPRTADEAGRYWERFQKLWAPYTARDLLEPHPQSGRVLPSRWDRIETLHVPTLVLNGDHDTPMQLIVADSIVRRAPNARRVILYNAGHAAHLMQTARFTRAVLNFLEHPAAQSLVTADNVVINYDVHGRGMSVAFLHGWTHSMASWDDQLAALSDYYRVIRIDRRGFGQSTGDADQSADPADLLAVLDRVGVTSATIVGHSAGVDVALRFALAHPDRVDALVLEGPYIYDPKTVFPTDTEFASMVKRVGLDSFGKWVMTQPLAWVPPDRSDQVLGRYLELWDGYNGRDALNPKPESGPVPPVDVTKLHAISVPVLVIVGDHEDNADRLLKLMPQAKRVVLTNAGHGGHLAQPEAYNRILKTFLDDVRRHTKP